MTGIEVKATHRASDLDRTPISPDHYKQQGIETIDFIDSITPFYKPRAAFYVANVIKYVARAPRKNGLEDLKKAQWYLNRLIDRWSKD